MGDPSPAWVQERLFALEEEREKWIADVAARDAKIAALNRVLAFLRDREAVAKLLYHEQPPARTWERESEDFKDLERASADALLSEVERRING